MNAFELKEFLCDYRDEELQSMEIITLAHQDIEKGERCIANAFGDEYGDIVLDI